MNQVVNAIITLSEICQRSPLHFSRGEGKTLTESLLEQMGKINADLTEEEREAFDRAMEIIARHAYRNGDDRWGDVCFSHLLRLVKNLDPRRTRNLESVVAVLIRQAELTASRVVARSKSHREIAFTDLEKPDNSTEWTEWGLPDRSDFLDIIGTIRMNVSKASVNLNQFANLLWNTFREPDVAEIIISRHERGMPTEFEFFSPVTIFHQRNRWKTKRFDVFILPGHFAGPLHFVFVPKYQRGVRGVFLTNQKIPSTVSVVVHRGWIGGGSVMIVDKDVLTVTLKATVTSRVRCSNGSSDAGANCGTGV